MPMLTPSQVHLDQPLTNLTLAYLQDESNFIAGKVFPMVDVAKQSDKYYIYDRENFNRSGEHKALAPRTRPERVGMSVSNSNYFADVYGLATDFDEQTLANEDAALEIRSAGANMLMHNMLIDCINLHRSKSSKANVKSYKCNCYTFSSYFFHKFFGKMQTCSRCRN